MTNCYKNKQTKKLLRAPFECPVSSGGSKHAQLQIIFSLKQNVSITVHGHKLVVKIPSGTVWVCLNENGASWWKSFPAIIDWLRTTVHFRNISLPAVRAVSREFDFCQINPQIVFQLQNNRKKNHLSNFFLSNNAEKQHFCNAKLLHVNACCLPL